MQIPSALLQTGRLGLASADYGICNSLFQVDTPSSASRPVAGLRVLKSAKNKPAEPVTAVAGGNGEADSLCAGWRPGIMLGPVMPTRNDDHGWQEALRRIEEARRSRAGKLGLKQLGLTAVPDSLAQLINLRELDLSDNQIANIPDFLAKLTNLRLLNLTKNQITAISDSVARLITLRALDLSDNQITTIPDSLSQLTRLVILGLSNNQITAIPDSLSRLGNLEVLYLDANHITVIPEL